MTGDGTLAVLQLLAIMKKQRKSLSELATVMENFPQVLKNVRTSSQIDVHHIPDFSATVRKMEQKLGDTGRIPVRPSDTESLIRVMSPALHENPFLTASQSNWMQRIHSIPLNLRTK
ncbi:MAG: hypothetical protein Q8R42_09640 [Desulfocapsaceae bacterium]|nr:hypothetical protein [Desulfocapsaceae bacterium]